MVFLAATFLAGGSGNCRLRRATITADESGEALLLMSTTTFWEKAADAIRVDFMEHEDLLVVASVTIFGLKDAEAGVTGVNMAARARHVVQSDQLEPAVTIPSMIITLKNKARNPSHQTTMMKS
jgi:hypothetical protein